MRKKLKKMQSSSALDVVMKKIEGKYGKGAKMQTKKKKIKGKI